VVQRMKPPTYNAIDRTRQDSERSDRSSRLARETSERERAAALVRARQRTLGDASSMGGDTPSRTSTYGDVYNRRDTDAAREMRRRYDRVRPHW